MIPLAKFLGLPETLIAAAPRYWIPMALFLIPFAMFLVLKSLFDVIDRPWMAVGFAFLGVTANVPLNALLIYGAGMGLLGSGIASLTAELLALCAAWLYWRHARRMRRFRLRSEVTRMGLKQQFLDSVPLGIGYLAESSAVVLATLMLGWFGAAALAANQIVHSIAGVLYMFPLGMATAVAIRVAQAEGARESARLAPIAIATFGFVTLWMVVVTIGLIMGGEAVARMLSVDEPVIALASAMFVVVAIMQIADGLQSTGLDALRGSGIHVGPQVHGGGEVGGGQPRRARACGYARAAERAALWSGWRGVFACAYA